MKPERFKSMKLAYALELAENYVSILRPHCDRIMIAGSIRRGCPLVNDIEIVCIPKKEPLAGGFFSDIKVIALGFIDTVNSWEKVKGEPTGKYTQRILPEGVKLDLFMATLDNFGLILAIRTGSANFSHKVLATNWVKRGYKSIDGMLHKNGQPVPIREEDKLFTLLGLKYVIPRDRD